MAKNPKIDQLEKQIDDLAAKLNQRFRPTLRIIIDEGDDEQAAMAAAVTEFNRKRPKRKPLTVDDFFFIIRSIRKQWVLPPERQEPSPPTLIGSDVYPEETEKAKRFRRRLVYPENGLA